MTDQSDKDIVGQVQTDCASQRVQVKRTVLESVSYTHLDVYKRQNLWWLLISVAFCLPIVPAVKRLFDRRPGGQVLAANLQILTNVVLLLACTALLVGQSYNPFLYYRF